MEATILDAGEARRLMLSGQAPANLKVHGDLDLSNEATLVELPEGLEVERLVLDHCSALSSLPRGLHCSWLSALHCPPG